MNRFAERFGVIRVLDAFSRASITLPAIIHARSVTNRVVEDDTSRVHRLKGFGLVAFVVASNLTGCAPGNLTKPVDRPAIAYSQQLADGMKFVAQKDWPNAQTALKGVIASNGFKNLPEDVKYHTLRTAAQVFADHGQLKTGYDYLVRATGMPEANVDDRVAQLRVASRLHANSEVMSNLTLIAQRYPERLASINTDFLEEVARMARGTRASQHLALLQSLYAARWRLRWDLEPSDAWRDLVLLLADKKRFAEAIDVSEHITDVYVLIAMKADRRFDVVVASNPARFDIDAAAERELKIIQTASENAPKSLELKAKLIRAFLDRRHYEGALAASDAILLDIQSTNYPGKLYDDLSAQRSWFLNLRADALEGVGRWDEAVDQMASASELPEVFGSNVDQVINLAALYCDLERPNEALSAINRMAGKTSAYGAMQSEVVRLDAAIQLQNSKEAERSLDYMAVHRADAPATYEDALLLVNQIDGAAGELVRQLLDADERPEALLSVQGFLPTPDTPRAADFEARRRATVARPDVQAAIRTVGRIESYPLEFQHF